MEGTCSAEARRVRGIGHQWSPAEAGDHESFTLRAVRIRVRTHCASSPPWTLGGMLFSRDVEGTKDDAEALRSQGSLQIMCAES